MSSPSALPRVRELCTDTNSTTILVFYRGEWCPFCSTWARGLSCIKQLPSRLSTLNARVIFISSQPTELEATAASHFHFSRTRGLGTVVHFVNDPRNELAKWLKERFEEGVVSVDQVGEGIGAGVKFPNGMVQPGVVCVRGLFAGNEELLDFYAYDSSGQGGVDGEDDRPPACTTLRRIEQKFKTLQCS